MIRQQLDAQLKTYASNVRSLSSELNQIKHGDLLKILCEDDINLKNAFHQLAIGKDILKDDSVINFVKDVSLIRLDAVTSFDAFDDKSLHVKPEMIGFLAKYLVKRRATYLYIYMLFQRKHIELLKIQKLLGDQYSKIKDIVLPADGVPLPIMDVNAFLLQLKNVLLEQTKNNKDLSDKITKIFNDVALQTQSIHTTNFIQAFTSLGELMNQMNSQTDSYKVLVTDVIPLIAKWNDSMI